MKTKLFMAFVAVLFAAALASCSKDDGDWDPMKWRTDVKTAKDGYVEVPEEGGTYVFTCKNYPGFWLSDATETIGTSSKVIYPDREANDYHNIYASWATISSSDAKLTVTIEPNATAETRLLDLYVTGGDIFDRFLFRQQASSKQYTVSDVVWYKDCPLDVYKVTNPTFYVYEGRQMDVLAFDLYGLLSLFDARYSDPMYIATSAFVADSVSTDETLRVPNLRRIKVQGAFFVEDVITPAELSYMLNEAQIGEKMTFGIYLLNDEGKALQKLDVTFVKVEKPKD